MVAEALGTFALVFVGAAVVVVNGGFPNSGIGLLGIALAHAVVLAVMVTATMTISGGHLNPAVTIGLLATRRIDPLSAGAYIVAQLAAACAGAALVKALLPAAAVRAALLGTPVIASSVTLGQAIGIELVLTFFLMSAVSVRRCRRMLRGLRDLASGWCCCSIFWWAVHSLVRQ